MPNVPSGDCVGLLRVLTSIDSRNPQLVPGAPGEAAIAHVLAEILATWGFDVRLQEAAPGRPNVIARIGPSGGPRLLLNGHLDVVGTEGMRHPPFPGPERDGLLYARGSSDMKGGVAAMCAAAARAAREPLRGEIVVAAVVDEEFASQGTRALLASGTRADAAVVTEPTQLCIGPAHRGFTWVELTARGRAAHGSRYDLGVDAIAHAAHAVSALDRWQATTLATRTHALLGHASLHASTITGGSGWSTYPDRCVVQLERRTLPGEAASDVMAELEAVVAAVCASHPSCDLALRHVLTQPPSDVPVDAPIVTALREALTAEGLPAAVQGVTAWTDAALFNEAGIPAICFGPGDMGLAHADEEWIALGEVERATQVLSRLAAAWCGLRS